jgi:N-methylhydantoinase A
VKFLGVDTGGTFTDFVYYDGRRLHICKVLSTPDAPERAILQGIQELNIDTAQIQIIHGSTVATNALLEGKGVRTAYIANRGLQDVLTIGRQARPELYNLMPVQVTPPVPHELCFAVDARLSAQGAVLKPLKSEDLARLVEQVTASGAEAVAINLLFSFLDGGHEQAIAAALPEHLFTCCSADVLPEVREYERGIATWINASLGPLLQRYLQSLQQRLPDVPLTVMQSTGGTLAPAAAGRNAVRLLLSGPAGGLMGARAVGGWSDCDKLLTFDMGGTSTDVALIEGEIRLTSEGCIGRYPVAVPMIDMHTIGAGGGSIARMDAGGMLQVGPESAAAVPGPACYGRGGVLPTVTDANVVLGRLPAGAVLAGSLQLQPAAAHAALQPLAAAMGMPLQQAAQGIVRLANEHMAQALRVISVQRGVAIDDFTLLCFGGAGGLHVCALAELMGMRRALVPAHAGVLSAVGMLLAPRQRLISQALSGLLQDVPESRIQQAFAVLERKAREELLAEGLVVETLNSTYTVDLRYPGQSYTLELPWQGSTQTVAAFHVRHARQYGHAMDLPVELVNVRAGVQAPPPDIQLPSWQPSRAQSRYKPVPVYGYEEAVPYFNREALGVGMVITGPAVVSETVATTFIDAGWRAEVDGYGGLLLTKI